MGGVGGEEGWPVLVVGWGWWFWLVVGVVGWGWWFWLVVQVGGWGWWLGLVLCVACLRLWSALVLMVCVRVCTNAQNLHYISIRRCELVTRGLALLEHECWVPIALAVRDPRVAVLG